MPSAATELCLLHLRTTLMTSAFMADFAFVQNFVTSLLEKVAELPALHLSIFEYKRVRL